MRLAEHQALGSSMIDCVDAVALWYQAGTGKTLTILDWVYRHPGSDVLVVCPASLIGSWKAEIDGMSRFEEYNEQGIEFVRDSITITSFERIYRTKTREVHKRSGEVAKKREHTLREEVAKHWDLIAVDEAHGIGNHSSVRCKMMTRLSPFADRRVIMTGTPVTGGGGKCDYSKLYGQLNFLQPGTIPTWTEFLRRYVVSLDRYGNPRAYNEPACEELMHRFGIFVRLDSIVDMPDTIETIVPVPIGRDAKVAYDDICHGRRRKWGIIVRSAGSQFTKLYQLCSGSLIRDGADTLEFPCPKDDALDDIINGTDGKILIFTRFRASLKKIVARYPDSVGLDGDSEGDVWKQVTEGDKRILVAQYSCGCTGLNLQCITTTVFYEPTLSSLELDQAKARTHRRGQTKRCRYLYLSTEGSIEEDCIKSVIQGVDVTNAKMSEWGIILNDDPDDLDDSK